MLFKNHQGAHPQNWGLVRKKRNFFKNASLLKFLKNTGLVLKKSAERVSTVPFPEETPPHVRLKVVVL